MISGLVICAVIYVTTSLSSSLSDEKRLIKHMIDNYERVGKIGRPVYNTSDVVRVKLGLALLQIENVDERLQTITTRTWMRFSWVDVLLKWNPEEFGGVDHVRIPVRNIWFPDIYLYNSAIDAQSYRSNLQYGGADVVVSSNGQVLWIPPMTLTSTCSFDLTDFPYDTQICHLKFGSWTYDGYKIDLDFYDKLEQIDITDYIVSNEWELIENPGKKNVKYYPCCSEPYPDLVFSLKIKRISSGYQYGLILPTAMLTLLTLVMFCIPPVMDAKINLGIFAFLGCFYMLNAINDIAPHGGATYSRLMQYLSAETCLVTIGIMLCTLTMNLARKGKRGIALPGVLKRVFNNCIGRILCVCAPSMAMTDDGALLGETDQKQQDWETFATVLDRIFFIVFAILSIIFAIAIR